MRKGILLLAFVFVVLLGQAQKLVVNEVSQGPIGNGPNGTGREYVELVVVGTPTCTQTTMDLRGWIVDDNNGWVKAGSGTGIANGAIRFKATAAAWQAIPYGSIILIYNDNDKNAAVTLPNDPTDANNDKVYVLPASSNLLERNLDVPFNSGTATPGYAGATWGQGTVADSWGTVALRNAGDAMLTVDPAAPTVAAFSFAYGDLNPGANATVSVPVMDGGANAYLTDANYTQSASWQAGVVGTNETPGVGNTPANIAWINSMRVQPTGVTVNPISSSNGSTLCIGSTTTLSSSTPGGTWSSANSGVVSVNAATGLATAVSVGGPVTITYTVTSGGCTGTATYDITVSAAGNAGTLSGGPSVCTGSTTTFTTTGTPGGVWSSSNTAIASINAATGVANGLTAGGPINITYTVGSGACAATATAPLTVVQTPSAGTISGNPNVCLGGTRNYTSTSPGGSWTSSTPANVGIDATTGAATGIAVGPSVLTYTVTAGGCSATTTYNVQTVPLPNPGTITIPSSLCLGQTGIATSTAPGGAWSVSPLNIVNLNATTGAYLAANAGTSTVTYTIVDANSCQNNTSVPVTVVAPANAGSISGNNTLCTGGTSTLTSSGTPGGTWSSSAPAVASVNAATGVVTALTAGSTQITYSVSNATCTVPVTTQITVTVNAAPVLQPTTGPATVCVGNTVQLTNPFQPNGAGNWAATPTGLVTLVPSAVTGGPSTVAVTGVAAGTATINFTVTNGGCTSTVPFTLAITSGPAIAPIADFTLCKDATTTLNAAPAGGTWSSANTAVATVTNAGLVTAIAGPGTTLTYTLTTGGCTATRNVGVTVNSPSVQLNASATSINAGQSVTLTPSFTGATPFSISSWTPAGLFANQTAATQTLTPAGTATYTVTAADANGCPASGSVLVTVNQPTAEDIFVPNFFTPNADGRNDILYFYGSTVTALDFRIFNQWGEAVFVTTDKSRGWDGSAGGKQQPVGVYMYVAKVTLVNGQTRTLKGSINLIR